MGITSVTKKGQVTIPIEVRRSLGIKEKDRLEVFIEGDKAIIRKIPSAANLRGSIRINTKQRGKNWKEIERQSAAYRGKKGA